MTCRNVMVTDGLEGEPMTGCNITGVDKYFFNKQEKTPMKDIYESLTLTIFTMHDEEKIHCLII